MLCFSKRIGLLIDVMAKVTEKVKSNDGLFHGGILGTASKPNAITPTPTA